MVLRELKQSEVDLFTDSWEGTSEWISLMPTDRRVEEPKSTSVCLVPGDFSP